MISIKTKENIVDQIKDTKKYYTVESDGNNKTFVLLHTQDMYSINHVFERMNPKYFLLRLVYPRFSYIE
jgi:hypothetical protein